jgi:serine/threonine protein kinase
MLRPDGYVKVLDFGLAKLTERQVTIVDTQAVTLAKVDTDPGTVMGTVNYMSPEQVRGQEVDARSDLFCFGAVLYEMVTSRAAFEGQTYSDVIAAILNSEPPPTSTLFERCSRDARMDSNEISAERQRRTLSNGEGIAHRPAGTEAALGLSR